MFAPPPVQMSKKEVQAKLEDARKKSVASGSSLTRTVSTASDPKATSLHHQGGDSRSETSPATPSRRRGFGFVDRFKAFTPTASSSSRAESLKEGDEGGLTVGEIAKLPASSSSSSSLGGFGEQPRPAPSPPKKSTRPPDEWFSRQISNPAPPPQNPPAPIPQKSPKRRKSGHRADILQSLQEDPFSKAGTLSTALSKLQIREKTPASVEERPEHPSRSLTAPEARMRQKAALLADQVNKSNIRGKAPQVGVGDSESGSKMNARLSGVKGAKVDKSSSKHSSGASSVRPELLDEQHPFTRPNIPTRRATDAEVSRKRGESMDMLFQSGFLPEDSVFYKNDSNGSVWLKLPSTHPMLKKELPDTPTSIVSTPVELYHGSTPRTSRPTVPNRKSNTKRSPLGQIAATNAKSNSASVDRESGEMSPGRLSAIPEFTSGSENSPAGSGTTSPTSTQIRLRNGSVITVSPPAIDSQKRSVYIQGPIKLPTPAIVPRKNSVASLDPFQDAVDHVYQDALSTPRRRSDDAVVDDVCDFFDDFGFDDVSFEGDEFTQVDEVDLEDLQRKIEDMAGEVERFVTSPTEQDASPVEKVMAREMVGTMEKNPPVPKPPIPPVKNEETLRHRGIARLQGRAAPQGRKDSWTLARSMSSDSNTLPVSPVPEDSMLQGGDDDVEMEDSPGDQVLNQRHDEIEELDGTSTWLTPGGFQSPMKKVKRMVASASTSL